MGRDTKIEWADHTMNFWIGCTAVSPGCANCYAEAQDARYHWTPQGWGAGKPRRRTSAATWANLKNWDRQNVAAGKRERVFVNSLSDIFDEDPAVPHAWRAEAFNLMAQCRTFDYLLVTKRVGDLCARWCHWLTGYGVRFALLASVENQEWAEKRIPRLLAIPATWHGISMEPMLGPVDLAPAMIGHWTNPDGTGSWFSPVPGKVYRNKLDWVIVGGESNQRPMDARLFRQEWGQKIAEQCAAAGVSFFFKQQGSKYQNEFGTILNTNKGQHKEEWAPWMVQQYPRGMAVDGVSSAF